MERLSVRPATGAGRVALVVVESLTKIYEPSPIWMRFLLRSAISEPVVALDGVSLSVPAGGITAIVGPNGAGKSTLFRVLTGLTSPTSGSARIDGVDVADAPRAVRSMIGFVPSGDQTLYLRLTCTDNLAFHGRLQGIPKRELPQRIGEVLELVGLSGAACRVGFALSAGMRGRLQLARALLGRPRLLVLDEPTAAIDPVGAYELLGLVQSIAAEQGVSVLLSSHRLEEIEALGNHLVLMDRGRIVYDGGLAELRQRWQRPRLVLRFAAPRPPEGVARLLSPLDVEVLPGTGLGAESGPGASSSDVATGDEIVVVTLGSSVSVGSVLDHLRPLLSDLLGVQEAPASLRDVIYGVLAGTPTHAGRGDTRLGLEAAASSTSRVVPRATKAAVGSDRPPDRVAGLDAPSRGGR